MAGKSPLKPLNLTIKWTLLAGQTMKHRARFPRMLTL